MSLAHWGSEPGPDVSLAGPERAIEITAARFVRTWGFTTIEMVAACFRLVRRSTEPRAVLARRAIERLPDLCWLEPTREWFSLLERDSPGKTALAKIAAVTTDVDGAELHLALGKRHAFRDVPPAVVESYLAVLTRLPRPTSTRHGLTPEETALVLLLRADGGSADVQTLRARAADLSLDGASVARTLRVSPLFLPAGRGRTRLIGSPRGYPMLVSSPAWQATM
ncbi:MAG TPA: hypothetical protein VLA14_18640 [Polyangia bacterium]|nr:hypothetical protein [Polyangia bacterium]